MKPRVWLPNLNVLPSNLNVYLPKPLASQRRQTVTPKKIRETLLKPNVPRLKLPDHPKKTRESRMKMRVKLRKVLADQMRLSV